jgi:RluA family pseudouridine synthase
MSQLPSGQPQLPRDTFPVPATDSPVPDVIKLSSPATREYWEIPVLFEDPHLLALDKPAGLLTSPDRDDPTRPNLIKLLHIGIAEKKPWARARGLAYLAASHRLEGGASGVILLAKTKAVLIALTNVFGVEKPIRSYVALAQGAPTGERFEVNAPLAPFRGRPGTMRVDPRNGKRARTLFETRERFQGWTLLTCWPLQGRTHQIGTHLAHARMPLAGDRAHGGRPLLLSNLKPDYRLKEGHDERPLTTSIALHAEQLAMPHPVTDAPLSISAPWPKELTVAVKYLRRYAAPIGLHES